MVVLSFFITSLVVVFWTLRTVELVCLFVSFLSGSCYSDSASTRNKLNRREREKWRERDGVGGWKWLREWGRYDSKEYGSQMSQRVRKRINGGKES